MNIRMCMLFRVSRLGSTSLGGHLAKKCMKITKSTFFGQNSERDIGMGGGGGRGSHPLLGESLLL